MERTRRSFFYLVTYLTLTGLVLILNPQWFMKLLFSNGSYDDVFPRVFGLMLLGLATLVFQIIRLRAEIMYATTLWVRAVFIVGFTGFYLWTRDPMFLGVLAVITLGVVLTSISYRKDLRDRRRTVASENDKIR